MRWKTFAIGYSLALALLLFAQRRPAAHESAQFTAIIDLTHPINPKAPTCEVTDRPQFTAKEVASYDREGYFARELCLPEHFSTHMDAPAHLARGRWTVDQIPAERLIGPLVVLDVSSKTSGDADYQVSIEDIARWEQVNGEIAPGAIVMARTGWSTRWQTPSAYRNPDAKGTMHFPGFSAEAARFLVESRNVVGLGIDTLSLDPGKSKDLPVHKYLGMRSIYGLENVANLGRAPEAGAIAMIAPAKIEGGSGAPVRIMALVR